MRSSNYRFKKQDLRKNMYHTMLYNEPRLLSEREKEEAPRRSGR